MRVSKGRILGHQRPLVPAGRSVGLEHPHVSKVQASHEYTVGQPQVLRTIRVIVAALSAWVSEPGRSLGDDDSRFTLATSETG
jgi:hypothetical protein